MLVTTWVVSRILQAASTEGSGWAQLTTHVSNMTCVDDGRQDIEIITGLEAHNNLHKSRVCNGVYPPVPVCPMQGDAI